MWKISYSFVGLIATWVSFKVPTTSDDKIIPEMVNKENFLVYEKDSNILHPIYYAQDHYSLYIVFDPPVSNRDINIEIDVNIEMDTQNCDCNYDELYIGEHANVQTSWVKSLLNKFQHLETWSQIPLHLLLQNTTNLPQSIQQQLYLHYPSAGNYLTNG
nr:hypothetical protein [Abalone asfa-like virus]